MDSCYTQQYPKKKLTHDSKVRLLSVTGTNADTLIVWTDRATQLDIALSFQDPEGCEDIWQFIMEVQKHLNNQIGAYPSCKSNPSGEEPKLALGSSSPLAAASPLINCSASAMGAMARDPWQPPSLANIK